MKQWLLLLCPAVLLLGCGNDHTQKNTQNSSSSNNANNSSLGNHIEAECLSELNRAFSSDYCGLWQFYKRKPYNEPERLITETEYLELKHDKTYLANGQIIYGSGQWFPSFSSSDKGKLETFIVFIDNKTNGDFMTRNKITTVRAELISENGIDMLKISHLKEASHDYYIKK